MFYNVLHGNLYESTYTYCYYRKDIYSLTIKHDCVIRIDRSNIYRKTKIKYSNNTYIIDLIHISCKN